MVYFNLLHFHACDQENEALFDMDGNMTDGEMPKSKIKHCRPIGSWQSMKNRGIR